MEVGNTDIKKKKNKNKAEKNSLSPNWKPLTKDLLLQAVKTRINFYTKYPVKLILLYILIIFCIYLVSILLGPK